MAGDEGSQGRRFEEASAASQARWRSLRDAVVSELRAVGLPVRTSWNSQVDGERGGGIVVDVNTAADIGGVQISWAQPDQRLTPLAEALEAHTLTESMMLRYGQVTDVLTKAAVLVLGLAGFAVRESERPYSALEYEVLHGPGVIESDDQRSMLGQSW